MTVTKEQVYKSLGALLNDALCSRDGYGETRKDYVVVDTYITQLEKRVKVLEEEIGEAKYHCDQLRPLLARVGTEVKFSDVISFGKLEAALAGGKDGVPFVE